MKRLHTVKALSFGNVVFSSTLHHARFSCRLLRKVRRIRHFDIDLLERKVLA